MTDKESSMEKILLRIFAANSALGTFTSSNQIIQFLKKLLAIFPGATTVDICLRDFINSGPSAFCTQQIKGLHPMHGKIDPNCLESYRTKGFNVYPVKTADEIYGFIAIKVTDPKKFEPYDSVMFNLVISLSVFLENKFQKIILEKNNQELMTHRLHLSQLVKAKTISLHKAQQKLEKTFDKTIAALGLTIEQNDPFTAGHQYRVAKLAEAISEKLKLSEKKIHDVYLGGLIHDIGKIHVPSSILISPAKLTTLEYEFIKTHPEVGYKIAKSVPFNKTICDIVLHHHERLDGSGYPDGLTEDEILLTTKIVSIADVFEAMSSHRPYRAAHSVNETLEELSSGSGTLYDPKVVKCCIELIVKDKFVIPKPPYQELIFSNEKS